MNGMILKFKDGSELILSESGMRPSAGEAKNIYILAVLNRFDNYQIYKFCINKKLLEA